MSVTIRPYVVAVEHVEGCKGKRCGPLCKRKTDGWEADIRFDWPDGEPYRKRVRVKVATKSEKVAKEWAEQRERDIYRQGKPVPQPVAEVKKEVPTLAQFAPRFIEGHGKANRQKASTIYAKDSILRKHLIPWAGDMRLNEITDEQVQRLKATLAKHKPKTTNNILVVLGKLLRVAVKWKEIERLPVEIELLKVTQPPPEFYDFGEYQQLLDAAEKLDTRTHAAILLGGDAGLRDGEILALEWGDIDLRRRIVTVQRQVWRGVVDTPKGGCIRHVPMTKRLAATLAAARRVGAKRVLLQDDGTEVTYKVLRRWARAAQARAGLKATGNVHILRHSFCSHLAMKGAPVKTIQELAGHQHLSTTMRYMHLSPGVKEQAIRLLDEREGPTAIGDILETEGRK